MALSASPGEDDILARLAEIPGVDVMESDYVDDSYAPKGEQFPPYILVKFNGAFQEYDNGIVGPDKDSLRTNFTVYVVSPEASVTRSIRDQVRVKLLTNFHPTDGSSLRPSTSYSFVDADLGFHRYVQALSFNYSFNLNYLLN